MLIPYLVQGGLSDRRAGAGWRVRDVAAQEVAAGVVSFAGRFLCRALGRSLGVHLAAISFVVLLG
jgi:hypothetical protein